jgi:hypothetical protein
MNWDKNIGSRLIKSVGCTIGGHSDRRWCCDSCGQDNKEDKNGETCGKTLSRFSYGMFRKSYYEQFGEILTDKEIDRMMEDGYLRYINIKSDEEYPCPSTSYSYRSKSGTTVDFHTGNELNLWKNLH